MGDDWGPTRNTTGNKTVDQKGKSRFEITALIQVFDKDFTKHLGKMVFDSFGVRKGREIHAAEVIKSTSLEGLLGIIRSEKAFTLLWSSGGWDIFTSLKGKKIEIELDFTQWTPGDGVATHHNLKLFDAHVREVFPDIRTIDKKAIKLQRINGKFGHLEYEAL